MLSMFNKRRSLLIEQGGGDGEERPAVYKRPTSSLQLCLQLALICACVVILFFGLAITALGLWGYHSQKSYLTITDDDPEFTKLPYSMMVTGGFVAILGLVGVTGSIFSRTITGQTLLGVFSFVLVLVIISEVGAGAAAIHLKFNLEDTFEKAAIESQKHYNTSEVTAEKWDTFQQEHECCGAKGYVGSVPPYYHVFKNESVPISCCKNQESEQCREHAFNATRYRDDIFDRGCTTAVIVNLRNNTIATAITAIVVGSTQLLAVLLAVVVAYMSSKLDSDKGSYSYNKLLQQDENSQPTTAT